MVVSDAAKHLHPSTDNLWITTHNVPLSEYSSNVSKIKMLVKKIIKLINKWFAFYFTYSAMDLKKLIHCDLL